MKTIGMISLGCPKNQVDSEVMLGSLKRAGYEIVSDLSSAETIIINTCSFIESAKKESIETIIETAQLKKTKSLKKLVVAGCLPQRYMSEMRTEIPEVDAFLAVDDIERIAEACSENGEFIPRSLAPDPPHSPYNENSVRVLTGKPFSAYVKIAEGCDHQCSFCTIPTIRGRYRSRTIPSIMKEVRMLAEEGIKEINLVAQDTTAYGSDGNVQGDLPDLLTSLSEINGIHWIRLLYGYPSGITNKLLKTIAKSEKICAYLDIPFQHGSPDILKRMQRGGSAKTYLSLIEKIREIIPSIALRTSIIVGFPGETEEDFNQLLRFCVDAQFDHLGVFRYSHEEGTEAYRFKETVSDHLKEEREQRVMDLQQGILQEKQRERVGHRYELLCEGVCDESDDLLTGRLAIHAPDVDGRVIVNEGTAQAGEFVSVEITESHPYDLIGRIVG